MTKTLSLKNENTKYLLFFLGTSLIAPTLYHSIGLKGTIFLPIFLSLTIGSSFLNPAQLLLMAIASPIMNMILFNMPTGIMTYVLVFEGIVFSLANMKFRNIFVNILISRFSSIALTLFLSGYTLQLWKNNFALGIPGIILNGALALYIGKKLK